ncbi:MAG: electron transfer flavoprotein subunit alpha/FixB family protein [Bryobacteraceae bacterium]|nr:electron transfer flavoprotein subunit alpha/FixB family protein [Bryobacteraceae bacterium]
MEQSGGQFHRMSFEALAAAQGIASGLELPVCAAVVGHGIEKLASDVAAYELQHVYALDGPALAAYTAEAYVAALEALIREIRAEYIIFPHTYQVRDFAPRLATRFGQVLVSDVVEIRADGDHPTLVRQLFQGKLSADVKVMGEGPCFLSVQAGAFRADQLLPAPAAAVVQIVTPVVDAGSILTKPEEPFRESARALDLTGAELIVSVGRGIGEKANISIVEDLAAALGAEIAASRPICDNGWLPMERQVGSSGQTVAPKVYLAIGISGAIQHLVGMKGAKTVIAINKDPEAPIFEIANYGIVGDLFDIVPAITEEIRKMRA